MGALAWWLLWAAAVLASALAAAAAYFRRVRHRLFVERRTVVVDAAVQCGGLVVAHLSDFHYDAGLEHRLDPLLAEVLHELEVLRPDLILLTGDFVNRDPRPVEAFCQRFACRLQTLARHGVFASLGNHDGYGSKCNIPHPFATSEDFIADALTRAGVRVLRNQTEMPTKGLYICGLEDLWNASGWRKHREAMETLESKGRAGVKLLMSHNPDTAHHLREHSYDVQFSGHTHGGQVCLPRFIRLPRFGPYNLPVLGLLRPVLDWSLPHFRLARALFSGMQRKHKFCYVVNHWEWAQGLHDLSRGAASGGPRKYLTVSRGIGSHMNLRLFCPPELTVVTVVGQESSGAPGKG